MRFAALRRLGLRKNAVGLAPFVRFSPPHFLCAGIASQFLYRAQKTSHTAKTLHDNFFTHITGHSAPSLARGLYSFYVFKIMEKFSEFQ